MLCFAFDSYVSDKRTLYFYFIATLVMKQAVLDCYVSEKSKLYLYFVATLVMKYAVFCLIVRLVRRVNFICTLLLC